MSIVGHPVTRMSPFPLVKNLYEYVKSKVPIGARNLYNHEQTPQLIAPKEKETMV